MYNMIIVDDEKQIRDGLKKMMPWEEYNIQICGEAENGQQALELVEHLHPQIIFTDIRMPVMDGIELLQELKQREATSKVVVLSGYDDFNLIRRAMKNGAMDYPVSYTHLLAVGLLQSERLCAGYSFKPKQSHSG